MTLYNIYIFEDNHKNMKPKKDTNLSLNPLDPLFEPISI